MVKHQGVFIAGFGVFGEVFLVLVVLVLLFLRDLVGGLVGRWVFGVGVVGLWCFVSYD